MAQGSRYWIALGFMLTLSLALAVINLNEDWRVSFRDRFLSNKREVLAKAIGDLVGGGRSFTVLKIKTKDALAVEVFENNLAENAKVKSSLFRARAVLPERRDAYFNYAGSATNLLLIDLNSEGAMEIVTAGFDENLIARVHVYKFNDANSSLELLGPDAIHL